MHEILLRELLTKNGLSPRTDVKLVRIDFFDMYNALAGKNIDAFLSGEPFPTLASIKGVGKILSYPYFNDTIGDINAGMLVTKGLIKNNPSLVLKLVKAHILATKYLARNEIEWLKKASSFGTNYNVLYLAKNNIKLSWLINADFIKKTKALGRRMLALGIIEREPDYDKMFDLSFVNEAIKSINE
jgi:NitT/TauT family transport system substrate-binding protein